MEISEHLSIYTESDKCKEVSEFHHGRNRTYYGRHKSKLRCIRQNARNGLEEESTRSQSVVLTKQRRTSIRKIWNYFVTRFDKYTIRRYGVKNSAVILGWRYLKVININFLVLIVGFGMDGMERRVLTQMETVQDL